MDEVFGSENFLEQIIWKSKFGAGAKPRGFITCHEYILCYSKGAEGVGSISIPMTEKTKQILNKKDEKFGERGCYRTWPLETTSMDERPNLRFPIVWNGVEIWPRKQWLWSRERVEEAMANGEIIVSEKGGKYSVRYKKYERDEQGNTRKSTPLSVIDDVYTQDGTKELVDLELSDSFDFPKPARLIRRLFQIDVNEEEDRSGVYLDFFAGSGTTAQAVLELNKQDGGNRKFILVQLPEPTGRQDYPTIADICKERVRRVIKKLNDEEAGKSPSLFDEGGPKQDRGFRVFKLAESNFKPWNADLPRDAEALVQQLELHIDHLREGRTPEDILYEILLKSGFPLTAPVEKVQLAGKTVYSVAGGALFICLERGLTLELIRAMAERKPERVVCLDEGFAGNDQLKANAGQIFKAKGVTKFKTV